MIISRFIHVATNGIISFTVAYLNSVFSRAKVFNVDEVQLINFFIFIDFAFGFKSKNSLTPDH